MRKVRLVMFALVAALISGLAGYAQEEAPEGVTEEVVLAAPVQVAGVALQQAIVELRAEPGADYGVREQPVTLLVYVVEGTLTLTNGDGTQTDYGAGSTFVAEQGAMLGLANNGEVPVLAICFVVMPEGAEE